MGNDKGIISINREDSPCQSIEELFTIKHIKTVSLSQCRVLLLGVPRKRGFRITVACGVFPCPLTVQFYRSIARPLDPASRYSNRLRGRRATNVQTVQNQKSSHHTTTTLTMALSIRLYRLY